MLRLVASLLLIRICCCWAFFNSINPPSYRSSLTGIYSSATSTGSSYSEDRILYNKSSSERIRRKTQEHRFTGEYEYSGLELWLDLRGTSLTPKTALQLWAMEGQKENIYAPPVKILVSSMEMSYNSPSLDRYDDIDVLIVQERMNDDDDMQYIVQQKTDDPSPSSSNYCIGRILNLQTSFSKPILPDPLPAMEHASNGQWIIIDTDGWKKIEADERLRMALPLLELISSSSATAASTKSASNRGGTGLTCQTNNEVVKTIMFIQSMMAGGGVDGRQVRTKTLTSGIVIPEDNTSIPSADNESTTHHFAIVVPYDIELLRTAQLLLST